MVHLVPHSADWRAEFDMQVPLIGAAMGDNLVAVHHIGSTAIPGILAKPIVDILVEVTNLEEVDACTFAMQEARFEAKGEYGIAGRRYFRRSDAEGTRTHHIHVFEAGSPHAGRHLAFRDFMLAHEDKAKVYSDLKARLAALQGSAYQDAKSDFVEEMQDAALIWVEAGRP